jgi:hypothetical protein
MAQQTETNPKAGGFIVSEAAGTRSRGDDIVLVSGQNLAAGAVLGLITASGKYAEYDDDAVDGTEDAVAILYDAVDASAADQPCVAIVRDAEVNTDELVWEATQTAPQIANGIADLAALGIIARTTATTA